MDFKSIISKIDSIEAPKQTPKAPTLPKAVKLNEDAELRVLAGTSTVLKELDMNLIKAAQKGQEGKPIGKPDAESDKNVKKKYGYRMDGEPAERDDDETKQDRRGRKRQNKGESVEIDTEKFQEKFAKMVEAKKGSKPDFLDIDKDGDKKEPMKKAAKEAGKGEKKETKGVTAAQKKLPPGLQKAIAKKKGKTDEGIISTPAKLIGKGIGGVAKGVGAIAGVPGGIARAFGKGKQRSKDVISGDDEDRKKKESMSRSKKKKVAESLEPILKFKDMLKLVQESGGQQQINPLDKTLFSWATRVAQNKLGEGIKAEVYAGMVYERNGGRFEMYDVLSEDRLDENWRKKLGAAAMAGIMGLGAMGGASAADMPGKDIGSDKPVAQVNAYKSMMEVEREVQDLAKVDKQAAKSYEATKSYYNKLLGKAKSPEDTKEIDKEYTKSLQTIIKLSTK